jgi:2-oxoglutarate ferredoxin oxidoreductase subunit alpha
MSSDPFVSEVDFIIRIAGEAGEGVISCGELFAKAASRTQYHVFTFITYPAEMKGGYSMIQIRVRDNTIYSLGSKEDYLVAFNQRGYDRSIEDVRPGGVMYYDPDTVSPAEHEDIYCVPVPFTRIAKEKSGSDRSKNAVVQGLLGYLFGVERKVSAKLLTERYGKKGSVLLDKNLVALEAGFAFGEEQKLEKRFKLSAGPPAKDNYMFLSGNEAVALGAITAGCRFVAGYPITPSTSIFETLNRLLPLAGGRALQMEDEIAAISAIIGASFGGEKVIVPTSGPGLQLMAEQLSLGAMIETPMVVVDVQRGGPSTGLPTKTEQSDLKFAVYGSAGESPRIILAPTSVEDSYYQTIRAFNLAERYQLPVIMLLDQSIGYRKATVKMPDFDRFHYVDKYHVREHFKVPRADKVDIVTRLEPDLDDLADFKRYEDTRDGVSPMTRPGTPGGQYLATGIEHDEYGFADQTPPTHLKMSKRRQRKMFTISRDFEKNPVEFYGDPYAEIGVLGWGSTEGAIREARYMAEDKGISVRQLHPHTIWPLPERQIGRFLLHLKYLIIVEENLSGQFAHLITARFRVRPIEVHKCEGVPFTPEEIFRSIEKVARIANEESITQP